MRQNKNKANVKQTAKPIAKIKQTTTNRIDRIEPIYNKRSTQYAATQIKSITW